MSLNYTILINGVVVNEPILVGSDVVNNALEASNELDTLPSMSIDWALNEDIETLVRFVANNSKWSSGVRCTLTTYMLCEYFLLNNDYLTACYKRCKPVDMYKIKKLRISQKQDTDQLPIACLQARDIEYLRNEYDYKSLLQEADPTLILPVEGGSRIKGLMDSLLPFNVDECYNECIVGEFVYSLIRYGSYANPRNEVPRDEETDSMRTIKVWCNNRDHIRQIVSSFSPCIGLKYRDIVYVFPLNSPICIHIDNCKSLDHLHEDPFDCFQVAYMNGSLLGSPAFHLCMLNDWSFELKKSVDRYEVEQCMGILSITNLDDVDYCKVSRNDTEQIEEDINRFLIWKGETPIRFMHLARFVYDLNFELCWC